MALTRRIGLKLLKKSPQCSYIVIMCQGKNEFLQLVQIQLNFTPLTFYNSPENFIAAFRTDIAGFFILNPFIRTDLASIWDRPQNNLFANHQVKQNPGLPS